MPVDIGQAAIGFLASVVAAQVSARLTVRLALKQFRTQKWWERQEAAYSRVMEALIGIQYSVEAWIGYAERMSDPSDEYEARYRKDNQDGWREVRRAAAAGAFLLSEDASSVLARFIKEADGDPNETYLEHLYAAHDRVNIAIREFREVAKCDLGVSVPRMDVVTYERAH